MHEFFTLSLRITVHFIIRFVVRPTPLIILIETVDVNYSRSETDQYLTKEKKTNIMRVKYLMYLFVIIIGNGRW